MPPTISVALCTLDGAPFLGEQLRSIALQSRRPDELVICDDGSSDQTLIIAERFAANASFPVAVHRGGRRLGVVKNFERAIALCRGEIVALADQDDIWVDQKLRLLEEALADHDLAFSDARRIDESGRPLPDSLWQHIAFAPGRKELFDVLVERNVVTGATLAFRSSWRDAILPIPAEHEMMHDYWIALLVASAGRVKAIDKPLIDYREHARQQRGAGERVGGVGRWVRAAQDTGPAEYASRAARLRLLLDRLERLPPAEARLRSLRARIEHLQTRGSLPRPRIARLPAVIRELPRYFRYSNHVFSIGKDLFWK